MSFWLFWICQNRQKAKNRHRAPNDPQMSKSLCMDRQDGALDGSLGTSTAGKFGESLGRRDCTEPSGRLKHERLAACSVNIQSSTNIMFLICVDLAILI